MSRNIVGLAGFAQSGKDSVGKILTTKYGYKRLAFADALRKSLYNLNPVVTSRVDLQRQSFWEWLNGEPSRANIKTVRVQDLVNELGWEKAKLEYVEIRELLQRLGTESGREVHGQDCWTEIVRRKIEAEPEQDFVITDVRFPNELTEVEAWGGQVYKVLRPNVTSVNSHVSDKDLEGVDYVINNNGTLEDLENLVAQIVDGLGKPIDKQGPCLI